MRKPKQEKYAYGARIALWLSRDPIKEAGGINLYGFVNNDPINYIDIDGLRPMPARPPAVSRPPVRRTENTPASHPVGRRGQQNHFPFPGSGNIKEWLAQNPGCHPPPRNAPGIGGFGRPYSGHAFDRMQERGYTPSVVESAIQTGMRFPGSFPNTTRHHDMVNGINVITNSTNGTVVTIY